MNLVLFHVINVRTSHGVGVVIPLMFRIKALDASHRPPSVELEIRAESDMGKVKSSELCLIRVGNQAFLRVKVGGN